MFCVYILQSCIDRRYYIGMTSQLVEERLKDHNQGKSSYTKKFSPWKLVWFCCFSKEEKAMAFESYLKTGSGYAFSRKRLV